MQGVFTAMLPVPGSTTLAIPPQTLVEYPLSALYYRDERWSGLLQCGRAAAFHSHHSTNSSVSFEEVFEHSASGKEAGEQLPALRQGKDTAADTP